MEGRDRMRAADTDREATAERLRVALEEGRLDLHEYDERLQQTYGAKTYAELDTVLADLPGPASAQRSALTPVGTTPGVPPGPVVDQDHTVVAGQRATPGWPGDGEPVGGKSVAGGPAGTVSGRWPAEVWVPWLRVAAILTVIWAISALGSRDLPFYWPVWVLGPWGAMLVFRTVGGFGTGASGRDVARRERLRAARARRRKRRRRGR
ncbi:DUF1707 domain-containing protein [Micromonospora sp. WMMD987]|uniref:DUF1707 SHOCT-like domain-containing protein n=1 Tax=Micromonospora TaxID=1873 RepID=UPI002499C888|nr:DUF1707 domain-containing protein [Micromonospora sp. WMMD987]WFE94822.1 DUF1707 domain-containing protein [Micromonospora sp. WMMD987]